MKRLLLACGIILALFVAVIGSGGVFAQAPTRVGQASSPYSPPPTPNPGDWPMYGRDSQRTNYNPDETLISTSTIAQLQERWRFNLGNSSPTSGAPSVANGMVFSGSSITSGNNFFALDAASGAQVWATSIGHGFNCFNTGIGSSSVVSGTVLSVGGGDQAFYGLNTANGAQLWREPMNVGSSGFPWSSPLLAYGRSFLGMASCADNPSVRGELRTVDMSNGSGPVSQYFVPAGQGGAGIWNSPALSPDGSAVVVTTGEDYGGYNGPYNRAIVSMDPLTLNILQSNQQGSLNGDVDYATTPLFFSDSQNRTLVGAVHKNGTFYAYELGSISSGPIWSRSLGGYSAGLMPAYDPAHGAGGTLFVANASRLYAFNPNDGTDRWPFITVSGMHGNMAVANGLLFLNVSGNLQIRDVTNSTLLRTLTPTSSGSSYTGPVVSHGFVYWLSGGWLNAWSLPGGSPTETSTAGPSSTPTNTSVPTGTPTVTSTATRTNTATSAPNTPTRTNTATVTSTRTATNAATNTPQLTNTATSAPATATSTATLSATSTGTEPPQPTSTSTSTEVASATPTVCTLQFEDVQPGSTFYTYVRCLACAGIISGYPCGGVGEPCVSPGNNPYFRPGANITRGQLSKVVANSAGFSEPVSGQTFEDVPPSSTFYTYIERLATREIMAGYACGGSGEPCVAPDNRPYFRPGNNATRGQIAKIVSNAASLAGDPTTNTFEDVPVGSTFWVWIERLSATGAISGYACGGAGEPCAAPDNKPYFRPSSTATRAQVSKIVTLTFFAGCALR